MMEFHVITLFSLLSCSVAINTTEWNRYHSAAEIMTLLRTVASEAPNFAEVIDLGTKTAQGRELLALRVTENISAVNSVVRPAVKLVSDIHGDEPLGGELLVRFGAWLIESFSANATVRSFLSNVDLWLVPVLNPDGLDSGTRKNSRGIDLNRNFPDISDVGADIPRGHELETQAMMAMTPPGRFALSAQIHTGDLVVNYPWDSGVHGEVSGEYSAAPDDALFRFLASEYVRNHPTMHLSKEFEGGITNGNAWYAILGGMQDWNYAFRSTLELTVEMEPQKKPAAATLDWHWAANRDALFNFALIPTWCGVRGTVVDADSDKPLNAEIHVVQIPGTSTRTNCNTGAFFRLLVAGEYDVFAASSGFLNSSFIHVVIPSSQTSPIVIAFRLVLASKATRHAAGLECNWTSAFTSDVSTPQVNMLASILILLMIVLTCNL